MSCLSMKKIKAQSIVKVELDDETYVNIRKPSTQEAREAQAHAAEHKDNDLYFAAELLKRCVLNDNQEPIFKTDEDINDLPIDLFNKLVSETLEVCGFRDAKKN